MTLEYLWHEMEYQLICQHECFFAPRYFYQLWEHLAVARNYTELYSRFFLSAAIISTVIRVLMLSIFGFFSAERYHCAYFFSTQERERLALAYDLRRQELPYFLFLLYPVVYFVYDAVYSIRPDISQSYKSVAFSAS